MIFFIFLISQNLLFAFNENLTAVHYSIVIPGIDEEIKPGMSHTALTVASYLNNDHFLLIILNKISKKNCSKNLN